MADASVSEAERTTQRNHTPADARAFEEQLETHGRDALRLARFLGHNPQDAADVVQEAAILAWRYRTTRRGDWKPWFFSIVRRVAFRQPSVWTLVPRFWSGSVEEPAEGSLGASDVGRALARLPRRQRAAVWLRYGQDLPYSDVARILGVREGAAKMLVARGRVALRQQLEGQA